MVNGASQNYTNRVMVLKSSLPIQGVKQIINLMARATFQLEARPIHRIPKYIEPYDI